MNPETIQYCQACGPFAVSEGYIGEWRVIARNRETVTTTDDEDVAYYLADAMNFVSKQKVKPRMKHGFRNIPT